MIKILTDVAGYTAFSDQILQIFTPFPIILLIGFSLPVYKDDEMNMLVNTVIVCGKIKNPLLPKVFQQTRGTGSPIGASIIRFPPTMVSSTTLPRYLSVTSPIIAAFFPGSVP